MIYRDSGFDAFSRNYILTQDFKVRGNYPGQRTESFANAHLKEMIQGYIKHFAGKITLWPTVTSFPTMTPWSFSR